MIISQYSILCSAFVLCAQVFARENLMNLPSDMCSLGPYCTFVKGITPLKEVKSAARNISSLRIAELLEEYKIPKNSSEGLQVWRTPSVVSENNCYNFATGRITNTFAKPGSAFGYEFSKTKNLENCSVFVEAIQKDGFKPVQKTEVPSYKAGKIPCTLFAAFITAANAQVRDRDFHFYRLMNRLDGDPKAVGYWWHKPGTIDVLRVDWDGKPIVDVEKANVGKHTQFCGYFSWCERVM